MCGLEVNWRNDRTRQFKPLSLDRHLKNSGDFNGPGFELTTSVMPVQCSYHLSYKATQLRVGQFVGLNMCEASDTCPSAVENI